MPTVFNYHSKKKKTIKLKKKIKMIKEKKKKKEKKKTQAILLNQLYLNLQAITILARCTASLHDT